MLLSVAAVATHEVSGSPVSVFAPDRPCEGLCQPCHGCASETRTLRILEDEGQEFVPQFARGHGYTPCRGGAGIRQPCI